MRTLLIGHRGVTWRGWLKEHRGTRELVCLDPADPLQQRPCQMTLLAGTKPKTWRFYGHLDITRAPHVLLAAAIRLLRDASDDVLIQAPAYRPGPVARQALLLLAEATAAEAILVAEGTELAAHGFSVGPEAVTLEPAFPALVETAQRRAKWMGFIEEATLQEVRLDRVAIDGARLGSGRALTKSELGRYLPGAVHAEVLGSTLFLVSAEPIPEREAARALDSLHAGRLHSALESDYEGLVCSLARGNGDDFAFGIVRRLDFQSGTVTLLSDAVPPAPATVLRLGSVRVDAKGNELGELRPWAL